jgi:hypothetical protein
MDSPYERSTRECRGVADLHPELLAGLRAYIEKYELDDVEPQAVACFETTSFPAGKRKKKEADVQRTGIILTPEMLFWVTSSRGDIVVAWARYSDLEVSDYRDGQEYRMIPDEGLNLFGFIKRAPERGLAFIGLGAGEAAEKLKNELGEAVLKAGGTWKR